MKIDKLRARNDTPFSYHNLVLYCLNPNRNLRPDFLEVNKIKRKFSIINNILLKIKI